MLALLAAAGCEKTNDVPRLEDEALAAVKDYRQRFDELTHRADALGKRGNALPPDTQNSAEVKRTFMQAMSKLEEYHGYLQQAPTLIQAGVKNGNPEELPKLLDNLRDHLEDGVIETTSDLAAVESWIAVAEQRRRDPRATAAPSATATVPAGSPPVDGSDAPIR